MRPRETLLFGGEEQEFDFRSEEQAHVAAALACGLLVDQLRLESVAVAVAVAAR